MKTLSIVAVHVLAGSLFGVAQAATSANEVPQHIVQFADLDLNQAADIENLHWRIRTAARSVCRVSGVLALSSHQQMRQCAALATAQAVADVNAPLLTRYHTARDAGVYHAGTEAIDAPAVTASVRVEGTR